MIGFRRFIAVLTSSVFLVGAGQAAVVNYDEFSDGELQLAPIPTELVFDMAGTHTVSGNISKGDIDGFFFDVGAGLTLTDFQIEASVFPSRGVRTAVSTFRLHRQAPTDPFAFDPFYVARLDFVGGGLSVEDPLDEAIGAGAYRLQNGHASNAFSENPFFGASYTLTFTVEAQDLAPIPLPASIFPLVAGLGGLFALRRKQTRRA